jgi:hypothetical protein
MGALIHRDRNLVFREFDQLLNLVFTDPAPQPWTKPHFQSMLRSFLTHSDLTVTRRELARYAAETWLVKQRRFAPKTAEGQLSAFAQALLSA